VSTLGYTENLCFLEDFQIDLRSVHKLILDRGDLAGFQRVDVHYIFADIHDDKVTVLDYLKESTMGEVSLIYNLVLLQRKLLDLLNRLETQ
jgi:hypothetical protein